MIDHILGRPSVVFRKYQVFAVVLVWSIYLYKFKRHGPPGVSRLSRWLSNRFTMHQALVASCVSLYVSRNFARVVGLESPEPLANLYDKHFFRATWITTALDAGFWTAMHLRPKWLRHTCEIVFTVYYLVCAEQADEMVRRVRGDLNLEHLQVSWNKPNTPVLRWLTARIRKDKMRYEPQKIQIVRPKDSEDEDPIDAWLYFDKPLEELKHQDKIVLDIPGGGFVAMDPRCHDDKLMAWASKLGIPVLALDYKKAPKFPFPYALHECYDTYFQLVNTRGRVIGLSGENVPKIIISGDSAGGNLAAATVMMIIAEQLEPSGWQFGEKRSPLPTPEAVVLVYPALDLNIGIWMTDDHLALMNSLKRTRDNRRILNRKMDDYRRLDRDTPYHSTDDVDEVASKPVSKSLEDTSGTSGKTPIKTRLAITSMISYFNDRIISPEMLRSMIIMYIGDQARPDFHTDWRLSPLRAPEEMLMRFPKTFLLCGEQDPLVDDTQIFAGRLKQAKMLHFKERQQFGIISSNAQFEDDDYFRKILVPGVSHGFLQFVSVFPQGLEYVHECRRFMEEIFMKIDDDEPASAISEAGADYFAHRRTPNHSRRGSYGSDGERPLEIPSKFRMTKIDSGVGSKSGSGSGRYPTASASAANARRDRRRIRRHDGGRMSPAETRTILSRLASSEDLMERRMKNMTRPLLNPRPEPDG